MKRITKQVTQEIIQKNPECFQKPTGIRNRAFGTSSLISTAEISTNK